MLDLSRNGRQEELNQPTLERKLKIKGVPEEWTDAYLYLLNSLTGANKDLIDGIIRRAGGGITIPMSLGMFEQYLEEFTIEYHPIQEFFSGEAEPDGYWERDQYNPFLVRIFYNPYATQERQRFTKAHELFHFAQTLDIKFLSTLDELILHTDIPPRIIHQLIERGTEKAAAMYLMPNRFFIKKYREIETRSGVFEARHLQELASTFQVSISAARFRLKECGLYVPTYP